MKIFENLSGVQGSATIAFRPHPGLLVCGVGCKWMGSMSREKCTSREDDSARKTKTSSPRITSPFPSSFSSSSFCLLPLSPHCSMVQVQLLLLLLLLLLIAAPAVTRLAPRFLPTHCLPTRSYTYMYILALDSAAVRRAMGRKVTQARPGLVLA